MLGKKDKIIIYAQDAFSGDSAKTGIGFIKYGFCETVAIVDRKLSGKKANDVISGLKPIPIFDSISSAKNSIPEANVLLIGIATAGGRFPENWINDIKVAIELKLNIVNGLHEFLGDYEELNSRAKENHVFIWDVRRVEKKYQVANARLLEHSGVEVILTVGTDAAIGKMTAAIELTNAANKIDKSAKFVATGQTGIMISGEGIPLDAVTGDFMAGAVEDEVLKAAKENYKYIFVEGQGSILHPAWSSVSLALLHGSLPSKLILCHKANREYLKDTKVKIDSLNQFIRLYEDIALPLRKAKVVSVILNTYGSSDSEALDLIKRVENETNLPADDVVRFSSEKILKSCLN